jgi:hypothetical protein
MRKVIIGLFAIGFVVLLFVLYALITDTKPIEVPYKDEAGKLQISNSDSTLQQIDNAGIGVAKVARYVILDPVTKEMIRVFGFEKLLSKGMETSRRQVKNPYLIFYDSDYNCRVNADTGIFQMDSSGTNSTPKDAELKGNVTIHVTSNSGSGMDEILIKMDDLLFSSERSEFSTNGPVRIESDQMELEGTGLVLIFDSANGRVDYLQIRDLDQIRIQGLVE